VLPAWFVAAASIAVVAAGVLLEIRWTRSATGDRQASAVTDRHLASLMADHLVDVASSDRHTVKPWFAGRIEFSPLVVDLAADGFPLRGGRLDYVDGHPAVALVYARAQHVINVFVWPTPEGDAGAHASDDTRGYHLVHWTKHGFSWWAVSDVAPTDLQTFAGKLAAEDR
jgi:anti-sigma factor RsiW